ncbi:MAG: glycosyltransferase [bacterium]|nr:MAG: glycosyltransferase [bacterium]
MIMKFITLSLVGMLLNLLNNLRLIKRPKPAAINKQQKYPLISILVPARNEEKNIEKCLHSLVHQTYPNIEIIVYDDGSTDRTYDITRALAKKYHQIQIIKGKSLPAEWTGKNYACYQLSLKAKGKWLLFTDADTVHHPETMNAIINLAEQEKVDFVSMLPLIISQSWAEKLFMPVIHFAYMTFIPLGLINKQNDRRLAPAFGPFMLFRSRFYKKIGGHKAVKSEIVEDLEIAKVTKDNGGKIGFVDGSELVKVRFYENFQQMWRGFSKNSFGAFEHSVPFLVITLILGFFLFIYPYLMLLDSYFYNSISQFAILQVGLISTMRLVLAYRFKSSFLSALLHPIGIGIGYMILMNSLYLWLAKGTVAWKERSYVTINK